VRLFWSRVECEAAVGSNVRSVPNNCPNSIVYILNSMFQKYIMVISISY